VAARRKAAALAASSRWVSRLQQGLARSRDFLNARLEGLLGGGVSETFYDGLEEALIQADLGVVATDAVLVRLRERARGETRTPESLRRTLSDILVEILGDAVSLRLTPPPAAILLLGVNGSGKTTTMGKLAHRLKGEGRTVLLAAADTFRAAAIEQVDLWAHRVNAEVIRHKEGADPAAVVYDAAQATRARNADVLIVDTAGRLHTKTNLMEELRKVGRVLRRELPQAPLEVLLTLDATTGQNGIAQARQFQAALDVTGIVLTKLDGTARGGIVIAIAQELRLPVKLVGFGEGIDDLGPFEPRAFVGALFSHDG
jgi:fused signal recognition particle receptor